MNEASHGLEARRAGAAHEVAVPAPDIPAPGEAMLAPAAERVLADPHLGERGNAPVRIAAIQRLQQTYGNRATRRLLAGPPTVQREGPDTTTTAAPQAGPAPGGPAPAGGALTQAGQEAEAAQTLTLLQTTQRQMLAHSNVTLQNTGRLFTAQFGRPARLNFTPMTLRSDNAALIATAGGNPASSAYYFYGLHQDNQHDLGPTTLGTIDNNTIVVRGRGGNGAMRGFDDLASTFSHESSHILVASYGEHAQTATDASSFDRYKDEFRAYWIEPVGHWAAMAADDNKAAAIRTQMVGSAATPATGYPDLQNRYWSNAAFKTQVDAHRRPDGFNLTNSPGLDVLFTRISAAHAGTGRLEDVRAQIMRLTPAEAAEALRSTLVQTFLNGLAPADATIIRNYLTFGQGATLAQDLNPSNSARVTALLNALEPQPTDAALKAAYQALAPAEKGAFTLNVTFMHYVDLRLENLEQRAAMYAMLATTAPTQFDAMQHFLDACRTVIANSTGDTVLNDVPAEITTTLRAVAYEARLALYRLVPAARQIFVDLLPESLRSRVTHALREDGDP
jgi:hypothetical protein